jgi:hypothetical protein
VKGRQKTTMNEDSLQGSEKYFFIGVAVVSVVAAYVLIGPLLNIVAAATAIALALVMAALQIYLQYFTKPDWPGVPGNARKPAALPST